MLNSFLKLFLFYGLAGFLTTHAAGDPNAGKAQYSLCAACHGSNAEGNPIMKAPRLAGLSADYLVRQITNYRLGVRGVHQGDTAGMQMKSVADGLSGAQAIEDVAAYIEALKPVDVTSSVEGDPEKGKMFWVVCSGCHGVNGMGSPSLNAPRLQGMSDWYLVQQLKNYQDGVRGAHPDDKLGQQMAGMAKMLGDIESIENLVSYINQLDSE